MCGAIPQSLEYVFMARYLVKHRDNFTFTFAFIVQFSPSDKSIRKASLINF